jgi:signal peptidase I
MQSKPHLIVTTPLKHVTVYIKRSIYVRQDLNIFNPGEHIKEYQQNYSEYILIMPTNLIPWRLIVILKEEEREVSQLKDGRISVANSKIGIGQKP